MEDSIVLMFVGVILIFVIIAIRHFISDYKSKKLIRKPRNKEDNIKKNSLSYENEVNIAPVRRDQTALQDMRLEKEDIAPEKSYVPSEKDKRITLTKKDFGKAVLSYIVIQHGNNFEKLLQELEKEEDFIFIEYLTYLRYIVYISEKILENRFSTVDACEIAVSSFDGIVEYLDLIADDKKGAIAEIMKRQYLSFKEDIDYGIYSEAELHSLVDAFLEDIDVGKDFSYHFTFFTDFSLYIAHHANTILDENIQVY